MRFLPPQARRRRRQGLSLLTCICLTRLGRVVTETLQYTQGELCAPKLTLLFLRRVRHGDDSGKLSCLRAVWHGKLICVVIVRVSRFVSVDCTSKRFRSLESRVAQFLPTSAMTLASHKQGLLLVTPCSRCVECYNFGAHKTWHPQATTPSALCSVLAKLGSLVGIHCCTETPSLRTLTSVIRGTFITTTATRD